MKKPVHVGLLVDASPGRTAAAFTVASPIYTPSAHTSVGEDIYRFEKGVSADNADFTRWLRTLPKPVAILACNDIRGQQVINACRSRNQIARRRCGAGRRQ
ncbi:MAG: hypothetical protein WCQ16_03135 [Verrucomicrobiae bacterium]